jgi:hypothetical protein
MYLFLVLLIILLVQICLLLVPFYISSYINADGSSICGFFKVKWFGFILYKKNLSHAEDNEDKKDKKDKKVDKKASEMGFKLDHTWFHEDAVMAFFRIIKGLIGSIHVEHILCKITFGFDDPADTAVACGYIWALTSAVSLPGTCLRIYPSFEGERLTGSLNAEIRGRLLWIFVAFINALREEPVRRLLKKLLESEMVSGKKLHVKRPLRDARGS